MNSTRRLILLKELLIACRIDRRSIKHVGSIGIKKQYARIVKWQLIVNQIYNYAVYR